MSVLRVCSRMLLRTVLPLTLGVLACFTDPDAVVSVVATPARVDFASIHAPAESVTVTVTGADGRVRADPVTWRHFVIFTGWLPGVGSDLRVERVGTTNRFVFRPAGGPTVMMLRADAGGIGSNDVSVVVPAPGRAQARGATTVRAAEWDAVRCHPVDGGCRRIPSIQRSDGHGVDCVGFRHVVGDHDGRAEWLLDGFQQPDHSGHRPAHTAVFVTWTAGSGLAAVHGSLGTVTSRCQNGAAAKRLVACFAR